MYLSIALGLFIHAAGVYFYSVRAGEEADIKLLLRAYNAAGIYQPTQNSSHIFLYADDKTRAGG